MKASRRLAQSLSGREYILEGDNALLLPCYSNQALGLAQYAVDFIRGDIAPVIPSHVKERVEWFHTDSVLCGLSALAMETTAPTVLREEALEYVVAEGGACLFGTRHRVHVEKAIAGNVSAVREWDSNGTVFGYRAGRPGHQAGEFGHNDYYPVVVAACQERGLDGKKALRGMVCLDEVRGRLAEVFSLKSYKIDHVLHGAVASAAVFGALMGADVEEIESAIGMTVAHYVPWRAIRAGHQLSDSKGASAALTTEAAVLSVRRSMRGFQGPRDIFRNPEALFLRFEGPKETRERALPHAGEEDAREHLRSSPFDVLLAGGGDDYALMGMHFKLGIYEHQSAGAIHGLIDLLRQNPDFLARGPRDVREILVTAYEPAFGIIGDPAKRDPRTRQSADHSMVFIIGSLLRKAFLLAERLGPEALQRALATREDAWQHLMLLPEDYSEDAILQEETRALMRVVKFRHGGPDYDRRYPDGIPTRVQVSTKSGPGLDSGLVMYPVGHARNADCDLRRVLRHKWTRLGAIALQSEDAAAAAITKLSHLPEKTAAEIQELYDFPLVH